MYSPPATSTEVDRDKEVHRFKNLIHETRVAVDTETAAYHLSRAAQTLRVWASRENGPIRPIRINGRLAWPVDELRRVLGLATTSR